METQAGADKIYPSMDDIFSLRKPKDIRAGIASGLKSVGKGLVGGAVGLVAAPVVGAATDGLSGFAKGVAAGVAGAVLLPATGVTVGIVQVARGVINQPEALVQGIKGNVWDQEERTWVEQPAFALTAYDSAAAGQRQRLGLGLLTASAGVDYYQLLEVPPDATPQQIKKQYYILARRHHPDKNVGDPEAHVRFQQLGEAYQVLSNPGLRQRYDAAGASGLCDVDFMDASTFYSCLFGSEMFDHLVGELVIATVARSADEGSDGPQDLAQAQAARVQQLVVYLSALLRRYVEGDGEGFKLAMRLEAERLASASFGSTMLRAIGAVYVSQADVYLGGLLGGALARVRQGRESIRSHINVANAALKVMSHQEKMAAFDRQCEGRRKQQQQQQQEQRQQQQQQQPQQVIPQKVQQTSASAVAAAEPLEVWDAVWFGDVPNADGREAQQQQQQQGSTRCCSSSSSPSSCGITVTCSAAAEQPAAVAVAAAEQPSTGTSSSKQSGPAVDEPPAPTAAGSASSDGDAGDTDGVAAAGSAAAAGDAETDTAAAAGSAAAAATGDADSDSGTTPAVAGSVSMDELLQRAQLEDMSMDLFLDAMWAANELDIRNTLGKVCQAVLHDTKVSSSVRQLRARALREVGGIFCSVPGACRGQGAKQQLQAAYEAALAKRMTEQEEAA